jgi:Tfp pilus assembly protein FimT
MRRHRGQPGARGAFTAVEAVIVVLIMGILAGVGAPRYLSSLAHFRLEAASRRVAADLRWARDHAQKVSASQTVDFDAASDSFVLTSLADPDHPSTTYGVRLAATYSVDLFSATFGAGDLVQFDMYGRPTNSGTVVLKAGTRQRTVQVDAAGQVRIL